MVPPTIAVRERVAQMTGRRTGRSLADEIALRCAALPVLDERSEDDILGYDATGLPLQDNGVGC